jgi:uncharacterized repeat protein (TIGR03803 family)
LRDRTLLTLQVFSLLFAIACAGHAQTFQVLHTFEASDGISPGAIISDSAGNLYGTASQGGIDNCSSLGCGTVFELSPSQSGWSFATLYKFQSTTDGWSPAAPLTLGPGKILYGATVDWGIEGGGGTVFRLTSTCTDPGCKMKRWIKDTLYRFGQCDGAGTNGGLVLDNSGNIYGTTITRCGFTGQVFELSPGQGLRGPWNYTLVHAFAGPPSDGRWVLGTPLIDKSGSLYGPTYLGGLNDVGTIYRLSRQGNAWREDLLYVFRGLNFIHPVDVLISDSSGSFYGVAHGDPPTSVVFKLTNTGDTWEITQLHAFLAGEAQALSSAVVMDAEGNLYGVGIGGGAFGYGAIYKLSQTQNGWSYSTLYDFAGGSDGRNPQGPLVMDGNGHLFGTAAAGGDLNCSHGGGCGTVWMLSLK